MDRVRTHGLQSQRGSTKLLADDTIPVRVAHVPVHRVRARNRGDPVSTGFLAGNPPVSIIVVAREYIITGGRTPSGRTHGLQSQRGSTKLLADDTIPVRVAHVPVHRVRARNRGDPVSTGFLAGNPPVSIIVVAREYIITGGRTPSGRTR